MNLLNCFALASGTYKAFSGEAWQFAGEMTLLGMGMIFAVLAALMGVLMIFKLVFAKPEKKAPKKAINDVKTEEAPAVTQTVTPVQSNNDETLIAVITAAIAEYRASEGLGDTGFRVVSFKRSGSSHWNSKR